MDSTKKRELGAYYTVGNPFLLTPFKEWFSAIGISEDEALLEPFAGSGQIPKLMTAAGFEFEWGLYDKNEDLEDVEHRDSLADFPQGYRCTVTNPPYLSYHFAKRKGLTVDKSYFLGYPSLYLTSIEKALEACDYVALIIPDSFATSGYFTERLERIIALPTGMFDDTEMPTCLALWGPEESDDFRVYRNDEFLGLGSQLTKPVSPSECSKTIKFNVLSGGIGLKAIDGTGGRGIEFGDPSLCPDEKVKVSARLVSRISVSGVTQAQCATIADKANEILEEWRDETADFCLTAFKGVRDDGVFRRRIDFKNARAILSQAVCSVKNCQH